MKINMAVGKKDNYFQYKVELIEHGIKVFLDSQHPHWFHNLIR